MFEAVNTGSEPTPSVAPEGHDAAMIAAVDAKEAELAAIDNPPAPEEPKEELLLGKFKSAEELAKAYQALESKLGKQEPAPEAPATEGQAEAANEAVESAGLDMGALSAHYEQNGELADAHYEALEKAGIPRAYVDQYIAGLEARANSVRDEIFSEVGGEEQFQAMAQWAAANMSPQELTAYNKAVDSRDPSTVRSAVMGLAFKYQKAVGTEPKLMSNTGNGQASGGFASIAQLTEAMRDPRYDKDPAYRREVEQKLARSNIL